MWALDHKEGRVTKNWCFWTIVLEKTLESPWDSKEIKPVNLEENQSWTLIWRTDAEAPILWPPDSNSRLVGKDPDAGQDRKQKEKRTTEDEMAGWHHQFNGHELRQTLGDGEGQEAWCAADHGITKTQTRLHNRTTKWMFSKWINLLYEFCSHISAHFLCVKTNGIFSFWKKAPLPRARNWIFIFI